MKSMKSIILSFLAFYLSFSSATEFFSTNQCTCTSPDLTAPCASTSGTSNCTSQINVNESSLIESFTVSVDIFHLKSTELIVTLLGPDGTACILYNAYKSSINMSTIYPTLSTPYQSTSVFTGKNMFGMWHLHVRDVKGAIKTQGIKWSLNLSKTQPIITTVTKMKLKIVFTLKN